MPSWNAVPKSLRANFPSPPARSQFAGEDEYEEARGYWQSHVGRSVAFAMQRHRETPRLLHYRVVPHNDGLVFAEPERADMVAQTHNAIKTATTWRELKVLMPPDERTEIEQWMAADDAEKSQDDDKFVPEAIPGWSDGDYPPWLQQEMDSVLPQQVLARFAEKKITAVNGRAAHF